MTYYWGPHIECLTSILANLRKLNLTRSIPGYEILVLACQRLPTGVRVYSYLQSHASTCLPEREILLAQWGARDCLQGTRIRVWQRGMPEVDQNLKSQTFPSSVVFITKVANKSNLGQICPCKTKTLTVGNLGQKWPRKTKTFTVGILGQKWPRKTKTFTVGILAQKCSKIKNFHCCYPWPKVTKIKQKLSPLLSLAKNDQEKTKTFTVGILGRKS